MDQSYYHSNLGGEETCPGVCSFSSGSLSSPPRIMGEGDDHTEEGQAIGEELGLVSSCSNSTCSTPVMLENVALSPPHLPFLAACMTASTPSPRGAEGGGGAAAGAVQQEPQQQAPAPSQPPLWTFPNPSASPPMSIRDEFDQLTRSKARGEERLKAIMASKEHARRSFPRIRRVWNELYMKIMVAGETGHGKTTFVNNMFMSYTGGQDVKPHDGTRTSVSQFLEDPDSLCARFVIENEDCMERVHYSIQDTPGYGDDTDITSSIRMIVDYVKKKNDDYFQMEKDYNRTEVLSAREDPRVDVCLYFIAAHRLKFIDIKFMQSISRAVSVIPIIAKADSMTAEETQSFRRFVMSECEKHNIRIFDFAEEAKAAVGIPKDLVVPPFAVVASNKFDEVRGAGSFWPVRDYHWGTCEAFSTQHSDCTYLKKLLLEEGFHDLRRATEDRYLEYRREVFQRQQATESQRRASRQRGLMVAAALLLSCFLAFVMTLHGPASIRQADPLGLMASVLKRTEVMQLSQKLKKKEHQLEMAEHKIDLLVKSVRDLEEHMSRLSALGTANGFLGKQMGGDGPAASHGQVGQQHATGGGGRGSFQTGDQNSTTAGTSVHGGSCDASSGNKDMGEIRVSSYLYGLKHQQPPLQQQEEGGSGGGSSPFRVPPPSRGASTAPPPKPATPFWSENIQEQRFGAKKKWF